MKVSSDVSLVVSSFSVSSFVIQMHDVSVRVWRYVLRTWEIVCSRVRFDKRPRHGN